jgi:hypothetical protein
MLKSKKNHPYAKPFLKWAGGKRGLIEQLFKKFPTEFNNYHEPFLGGGAIFFELYSRGMLAGKKAYLADINAELINAFISNIWILITTDWCVKVTFLVDSVQAIKTGFVEVDKACCSV